MGCASSVSGRPLAVSPASGIPVGNSITGTVKEWSDSKLNFALQHMQSAVETAKTGKLLKATPIPKAMPVEWESWQFDIFGVDHADLPSLAYTVLTSHPELSAPPSKIDKNKLWRFVNEIAVKHSFARPFHSFRHGCDVLLAVSGLLRKVRSDKPMGLDDPILVGGLLVGALVHDTNHPGCMNTYLIATKHPLAAESETAVLERHHLQMALTLIERPELNFLCKLSDEDRAKFLSAIKETVLATDVTTTMPKAKEFSALVADGQAPDPSQITTLIIKAADISNPTRPIAVYEKWVEGVMAEFFAQGDAEKAKGLPVSMNCDRDTVVVSKCQVSARAMISRPPKPAHSSRNHAGHRPLPQPFSLFLLPSTFPMLPDALLDLR